MQPQDFPDPAEAGSTPEPTPSPASASDRAAESPAADPRVGHTGLPAVDQVLDSLSGLEGRPVEEHVAVYEEAQDRLRRALDARPDS